MARTTDLCREEDWWLMERMWSSVFFVCDALPEMFWHSKEKLWWLASGFWVARVYDQSTRRILVNDQKYCDAAAFHLLPCGYHGIGKIDHL